MYVNPQLANYILTRSLSASICWIFGLLWWPYMQCKQTVYRLHNVLSDFIWCLGEKHFWKFKSKSRL